MNRINDKFSNRGKLTRAAVLAMALSGMMTLEAANIMLSHTNPQEAPITEEEFRKAQKDSTSQKETSVNTMPEETEPPLRYFIVSAEINDDCIEALLNESTTGTEIKMFDTDGDLVFDKITTLDGTPLDIKPEDLVITNLDEVLSRFRPSEPPVVIYGGPDMMDLYGPAEPGGEDIIIDE